MRQKNLWWMPLAETNLNCGDAAADSRQKPEAGLVKLWSHGQSLAATLSNLSTTSLQPLRSTVGLNYTVCLAHRGCPFCTDHLEKICSCQEPMRSFQVVNHHPENRSTLLLFLLPESLQRCQADQEFTQCSLE